MSADKKLAAALKQLIRCAERGDDSGQPCRILHNLQASTSDPAVKLAIRGASKALQSEPAYRAQLPAGDAVAVIRTLVDKELTNSAAVTFIALVQTLRTLDFQAVLPLAPTAKCLAAWMRTARVPKKLAEERILSTPDLAWRTAALDWYMEKGTLKRAAPLLCSVFFRSPRPKHLPQWDELLSASIQAAKGGALLESILDGVSSDRRQLVALATLFLNNPALLCRTVDLLPDLLESHASGQALEFCKLLLEHALVAPPHQRPLVSAAIARLATGLLLKDELSAIQEQALESIRDATSRLKFAATDGDLNSRTWVIEPLKAAAERPSDNQNLTMTGARHIAVAFEKARQGFKAQAVLSMTAKNLGMAAIGTKAERVAFNPLQHEDVAGGIMPGEVVEIMEPGWTFKNSIVLRTRVVRVAASQTSTGA